MQFKTNERAKTMNNLTGTAGRLGQGREKHPPSSRTRVPRLVLTALIATLAALATSAAIGITPASASTLDGTATVETPSGTAYATGATIGSTTEYTVGLPLDAACDGDTASEGYHVYTYLVPSGTDVDNLTIVTGHPSTGYGLFNNSGSYQGPFNTAPSTGYVQTLPVNLEWGAWAEAHSEKATLIAGTGVWEAGVLCANSSGVVTDYWNTELTFVTSGSDPDGFTWSAAPGDPNNGANPEVPFAIILPVLAVGILGATILIRRRRTSAKVA
jgi:hypothetical protein